MGAWSPPCPGCTCMNTPWPESTYNSRQWLGNSGITNNYGRHLSPLLPRRQQETPWPILRADSKEGECDDRNQILSFRPE